MRMRNPYGLYKHAVKPSADQYKAERRRLMREDWAEFCTAQCPHKGRVCDRGPCKEFREKFGRRKDA